MKCGPDIFKAEAIEKSIEYIINNSKDKSKIKILLIGRYNFELDRLERTQKFINNKNGTITSIKYPNVKLDYLTAHSSKGLGYDNVIIINGQDAIFGFPSKIENDPIMNLVIYNNYEEIEYAEERRLFYVALTRTKNRVYIITPQTHPSQFVLELVNDYPLVKLEGELDPHPRLLTNKLCPECGFPLQRRHKKNIGLDLWVCTNENEVCGFLSNNLKGGKMSVQKCTACDDGYLIVKTKDNRTLLGCTNYKLNGTGCNNIIAPELYDVVVTDNGYEEDKKTPPLLKEENDDNLFKNICINVYNAYAMLNKYGQYYGIEKLYKYVKGVYNKSLMNYDSINEKYFGIYSNVNKESILAVINWLIEKEVFILIDNRYPTLRIKNKIEIIKDEDFANSNIEIMLSKQKNINSPKKRFFIKNELDFIMDDNGEIKTNETIFILLRNKRTELAKEYGVSPFCVASNKMLINLATYLPKNKEEYLKIKYTGEISYDKYGKYFVELIIKNTKE